MKAHSWDIGLLNTYLSSERIDMESIVVNLLSYSYFLCGFIVLVLLQFLSAPYGRYSRAGWGFQLNAKLAWFLQEIPSLLVPMYVVMYLDCPKLNAIPNKILLGCFLLHYFQRSCIFPFLIKGGKPTPLFPFLMALMFCSVNGYLQAGFLAQNADFGQKWMFNINFYIGLVLFITGMVINIHSDHILRNLRKPGETGYKIPKGGMFDYVSGANFFGECVEWSGFAIANGTLPAVAFAIFTISNVCPRACQHHRWYLEKFDDYPKKRMAVIPYIL